MTKIVLNKSQISAFVKRLKEEARAEHTDPVSRIKRNIADTVSAHTTLTGDQLDTAIGNAHELYRNLLSTDEKSQLRYKLRLAMLDAQTETGAAAAIA